MVGGARGPVFRIVGSESVGVNSMRAEVHQLMDPLTVDLGELAAAVVIGLDHNVTGAVGKVGHGLMVGGVGEGEHFLRG